MGIADGFVLHLIVAFVIMGLLSFMWDSRLFGGILTFWIGLEKELCDPFIQSSDLIADCLGIILMGLCMVILSKFKETSK